MKTSLLIGTMLSALAAAIIWTSAQTQSASPAATASPAPIAASPVPRATATASPTTRGATTPIYSPRKDARVTPEITPSPSGGAQLEGESPPPTTRESQPKIATPVGTNKPTPSRPHRKLERREANTPTERPGEQK